MCCVFIFIMNRGDGIDVIAMTKIFPDNAVMGNKNFLLIVYQCVSEYMQPSGCVFQCVHCTLG